MFKPILPKPFKPDVFREEVKEATKPVRNGIWKDFRSSFQSWSQSSRPKMTVVQPSGMTNDVLFAVYVSGLIHSLVWGGTRAHPIRARRAKVLRFQSGYRAKTKRGTIPSGPGGPFGDVVHTTEVRRHPGFPGRFQDKTIADDWRQPYTELAQKGLDNGAKKSGHSI